MSKSVVVVGGGIAGLTSSLILLKKGYKVSLIESGEKLGGLLNNAYKWKDCYFDYGTHFVSNTGRESLDELLLGKNRCEARSWGVSNPAPVGNFFNGKLNEKTISIDLHSLNRREYNECCADLLSIKEPSSPYDSLNDQLLKKYGEGIVTHVFSPLMKKFFGAPLEKLTVNAHHLFSLSRVSLGSDYVSNNLKRINFLDDVLSFQSRNQGVSHLQGYYPDTGPHEWIENLEEKLLEYKKFYCFKKVFVKNIDNNKIALSDGTFIDYSKLVWTGASHQLLKLLSLKVNMSRPSFMHTDLHHCVFEEDFLTKLYYFYCYDSSFSSFRVTLYPNIVDKNRDYHCTVEVIRKPSDKPLDSREVVYELEKMGVIDAENRLVHYKKQELGNSFPVLSKDYVNNSSLIAKKIKSNENVLLLGKASGKSFFMNDVLLECNDKLSNF